MVFVCFPLTVRHCRRVIFVFVFERRRTYHTEHDVVVRWVSAVALVQVIVRHPPLLGYDKVYRLQPFV